MEERWDTIGPELSAVMSDAVIPVMMPFDATLDIPIDEQKYVLALWQFNNVYVIIDLCWND